MPEEGHSFVLITQRKLINTILHSRGTLTRAKNTVKILPASFFSWLIIYKPLQLPLQATKQKLFLLQIFSY